MSYLRQHGYTTLRATIPDGRRARDWALTVRWKKVLGEVVTLHREEIDIGGYTATLNHRLSKETVLDWFHGSSSESTKSIRWLVQVDVVLSGDGHSDMADVIASL